MIKRYKFRCWKCPRVYFQTLEITGQQKVILTCPYCQAEAVVNLQPYYKDLKTVFKREEDNDTDTQREEGFQAPEIFPTRKPD
jgi:hypothetical protein